MWQNEKVAPELLSAHSDLLGLVQDEANRLDMQAKSLPAGDLRAQIKRLQVCILPFKTLLCTAFMYLTPIIPCSHGLIRQGNTMKLSCFVHDFQTKPDVDLKKKIYLS